MKLQEVAFGLEHQLGKHLAVGARYIHKQIDRAIEDVGQLDATGNEIYIIGNPGFGEAADVLLPDGTRATDFPKAVRDYDAVELTIEKRLSNRWSARASYTVEPPLRQLLGPVAVRRERPHQPERRPLVRLPADDVRRHGDVGPRPAADRSSAPVQDAVDLPDAVRHAASA